MPTKQWSHNEFVCEWQGVSMDKKITCDPKQSTLIARPISDMSNEEKEIWYSKMKREKSCPEFDSGYTMPLIPTPESFMYELEIGVVDEDRFSTEDVIWRYENE